MFEGYIASQEDVFSLKKIYKSIVFDQRIYLLSISVFNFALFKQLTLFLVYYNMLNLMHIKINNYHRVINTVYFNMLCLLISPIQSVSLHEKKISWCIKIETWFFNEYFWFGSTSFACLCNIKAIFIWSVRKGKIFLFPLPHPCPWV